MEHISKRMGNNYHVINRSLGKSWKSYDFQMSMDTAIGADTSIYILGGTYMHSMVQSYSCERDKLRKITTIIFYVRSKDIITCQN